MKVHDDLADEPECDGLHTEHYEQDTEEQKGTVCDSLSADALHEEDQQDGTAGSSQQTSEETEKAERLLPEPQQKEEPQQVDQSAEIHSR